MRLGARRRSVPQKIAFARGLDVLSAEIPEGKDPADIVKESPALFPEIVKNAKPFIMDALAKIKKARKMQGSFGEKQALKLSRSWFTWKTK